MPNVLGRKLFKKQSSRGKGITSMLEDFPQGFAEGGEVTSPAERKRLAMDMLARAREEGFSFLEEGERPSLTRQAAVGGSPAMGPDPRAAQQLAMMQQLGMVPPRFQEGGMTDTSMFRRTMNALRGDMVIVDPRTGEPIQFIDPTNPIDVAGETALTTLVRVHERRSGIRIVSLSALHAEGGRETRTLRHRLESALTVTRHPGHQRARLLQEGGVGADALLSKLHRLCLLGSQTRYLNAGEADRLRGDILGKLQKSELIGLDFRGLPNDLLLGLHFGHGQAPCSSLFISL